MRYMDDVELEIKNGKLVVKQINFKSTFYNDFNELYTKGYIDRKRPLTYDFNGVCVDTNKKTISEVQPIRSYEAPLLQINDILIGALSYNYRNLSKNNVKLNIISEIRKLYQNDLNETSYCSNTKFNIFMWRSRDDID